MRLAGLVRRFDVEPDKFCGWGVFRALDARRATLEREASLREIEGYLALFAPLRAMFLRRLGAEAWLAVPGNASDMRQRFEREAPFVVRLVERGRPFQPVVVRYDGHTWWHERPDRRASARVAERLRGALTEDVSPDALTVPDVTPERRQAYRICRRASERERRQQRLDARERRLRDALELAGGELRTLGGPG